eukprot:6183994-Pleurochrysis_carterae.AAC.1
MAEEKDGRASAGWKHRQCATSICREEEHVIPAGRAVPVRVGRRYVAHGLLEEVDRVPQVSRHLHHHHGHEEEGRLVGRCDRVAVRVELLEEHEVGVVLPPPLLIALVHVLERPVGRERVAPDGHVLGAAWREQLCRQLLRRERAAASRRRSLRRVGRVEEQLRERRLRAEARRRCGRCRGRAPGGGVPWRSAAKRGEGAVDAVVVAVAEAESAYTVAVAGAAVEAERGVGALARGAAVPLVADAPRLKSIHVCRV